MNKELFTQEKEREFQLLAFNEHLRRQEQDEVRKELATKRQKNLQILAIGAFIVTFCAIVLWMSRNRSTIRAGRLLGVVGLLLIYEFINLLLHPWIEHTTRGNPIYALLILVLVASFLVPTHQLMETWLKNKLFKRRRRKAVKNTAVPIS